MKYLLCLVPLLFTSCSMHLQQSSRSWDQAPHRQVAVKKSRQWHSANNKPARKTHARFSKKPTATLSKRNTTKRSKGQVPVPDLPEDIQLSGDVADIMLSAEEQLGTPYVYGGASPQKGFDCSGFVFHVFKENGKSIQRTADKQYLQGRRVKKEDMQPGDLVFFSHSGKYVDHVGIYAGDNLFIHAPRTGRTVSYDSLDTGYYRSHFRGAKRLL